MKRSETSDLWIERVPSPLGPLLVVSDGAALCALDFHDYEPRLHRLLRANHGDVRLRPGVMTGLAQAVDAYFGGSLAALDRVSVRAGGTPFQRRVWAALRTIPVGTSLTYGALAARLGQPKASRAVGLANGRNPIAIVVPCHRVIGANGALTGFGGGLHRKQWLLAHEGAREGCQRLL